MAACEALLAFWHEAGVDACYLDTPVDHTEFKPLPAPAAVQKLAAVVPARGPINTTHAASGAAAAREMAASAQDMDALASAVAAFDGCALKRMGARMALLGRGNPQADLLVIGDAPTDIDDAAGRPFAGPEGQMLDRILQAAGLADRAYLTQTVFWHPPGNRAPTPDEQAVCLPFIERAAELVRPRAILILGSVAARGVLSSDQQLLKLRGKWQEWSPSEAVSVPAMPTFHPGFLLQQPLAKGLVWHDILEICTRLASQ